MRRGPGGPGSVGPDNRVCQHRPSASSSGRPAANTLESINLDIFFMSTGAWSVSRGVGAPSLDKVERKRAAMEASSRCVLLADSTKYGTFSKFQVTALDQPDAIISDSGLSADTRHHIEELGVEMRSAAGWAPIHVRSLAS